MNDVLKLRVIISTIDYVLDVYVGVVVMIKGKDINKSRRGMLSIGKRVCLCSM